MSLKETGQSGFTAGRDSAPASPAIHGSGPANGGEFAGHAVQMAALLDLVHEELLRVEQVIQLESVAPVDSITTIGHYLHGSGGKRLRPILVLLSGKLFGRCTDSTIRMAAVVEMIHTATLVHDDVIDYADIRRGRPSTNALWGNQTSVLTGDWLYMQAFQIALRERNFAVLDLLIGLTQSMVEGELLQLGRIGRIDVSEADYMELVDRKTASLFSVCARLGAIFAGADDPAVEGLGDFGWNLGMAFQLVDDVLDFTAHENVLGKPVGSDLREGKVTLPLIYALVEASPEDRRAVETVLRDGNYEAVPFESVLGLVHHNKGIERAMHRAGCFAEKAKSLLAGLPDSPSQKALLAVTDLVTEREY